MAKYDQSLKSLISRAHDGFLPLISPDYVWREELSPELPAHARQADILWLAYNTRTEREFLLHIELQLRVEDDLGIRMAEYGIRAHRRTPIPLRSVVIFLKPSNTIPTTPYIIPSDNEEYWMLCNYKQIKLWEIPQSAVLATSSYDLWPLAALMQDVTRESIIATAQQIATAPAARAERTLLNDTLINFSGIRLASTVVRKIVEEIEMMQDIWEESSTKDALREIAEERAERMAKPMAEGMAKVMAESMAESMTKVKVAMFTKMVLVSHFGPLSADLSAAIDAASEETLLGLAEHIGTETLAQIRERLALTAS